MFRALIVGSQILQIQALEQIAQATGQVTVYKLLNTIPSPYELAQLINGYDLNLLLLDVALAVEATTLLEHLRQKSDFVVIGFGQDVYAPQPESYPAFAALLPPRLTPAKFQEALRYAVHRTQARIWPNLFAFLPAKAGSGASTTALQVAGRLAQSDQRVLMLETDLHSGVASVLLQLGSGGTLRQALDHAATMDQQTWEGCRRQALGMDLLVRDGSWQGALPSWNEYHTLLRFLEQRYDALVVDLPEVVNEATFETVRRAHVVAVVCTTELPSLVLARQRCEALVAKGVAAERLWIVLNRWQPKEISVTEVREFVGREVLAVLPNDYPGLRRAILESRLVEFASPLGEAYTHLARQLAQPRPTTVTPVPAAKSSLLQTLRTRFAS